MLRRKYLHYIMDPEITSDMLEQFALDRINTLLESVKARAFSLTKGTNSIPMS